MCLFSKDFQPQMFLLTFLIKRNKKQEKLFNETKGFIGPIFYLKADQTLSDFLNLRLVLFLRNLSLNVLINEVLIKKRVYKATYTALFRIFCTTYRLACWSFSNARYPG